MYTHVTFNRFSRFTKFSTKKSGLFCTGTPWGTCKILGNYTLFFCGKAFTINHTTQNSWMHPTCFPEKKGTAWGNFFGEILCVVHKNVQQCTLYHFILFLPAGKAPFFFRENLNITSPGTPNKIKWFLRILYKFIK